MIGESHPAAGAADWAPRGPCERAVAGSVVERRAESPLPHSVEAEQAVLGGVLIDNGAWDRIAGIVTAAHFYRNDHRAVFGAVASLCDEGQPCDAVTVAERLDRDGLLDSSGGLAYLADLARNTPNAANIVAYAEIVREYATRRALIREMQYIQDAAFNRAGRSMGDIIGAARERIEALTLATPTAEGSRFTSLGDLFDEQDEAIPWLVDRLLPAGGLSLILGKPKAGKSTLARCLCVAVATGQPWLGRACMRGPVAYLALEEKRFEVRRHLKQLGALRGSPIHVFVGRLPKNAEPIPWLRGALGGIRPALIVIDPLARFVRVRDGNDYSDVTRRLEPLISFVRDASPATHIALVHHSRKGAGEHGDESLGSTAILGSVDTAISLKREKASRLVYSVNRYGEDLPETFAVLDAATGWVTPGTTRQEAVVRGIEDEILDFVRSRDKPATQTEIRCADGVTGKAAVLQRALRGLVESGRLKRTGRGVRNGPFRYSFPFPSSK